MAIASTFRFFSKICGEFGDGARDSLGRNSHGAVRNNEALPSSAAVRPCANAFAVIEWMPFVCLCARELINGRRGGRGCRPAPLRPADVVVVVVVPQIGHCPTDERGCRVRGRSRDWRSKNSWRDEKRESATKRNSPKWRNGDDVSPSE